VEDTGKTSGQHNNPGQFSADTFRQEDPATPKKKYEIASSQIKKAPQFVWWLMTLAGRGFGAVVRWLDNHDGLVTAAATIAIAVLTYYLADYAGGQEKILNQQIADARATNRAVIYFDDAQLISYPQVKPVTLAIIAKVVNSGGTPARAAKLAYSCPAREASKKSIDPYDLEPLKPQFDPPTFFAAKQEVTLIVCQLPLTLLADIKNGTDRFVVMQVSYNDTFSDEPRVTQTTRIILADDYGGVRLGYSGSHNCADDDCPKQK
jgi:hypothetical protein